MENVTREKHDMDELVNEYKTTKLELYKSLNDEFSSDLKYNWNATIDSVTLSIKFDSPKVQFEQGSSVIPAGFCEILTDFFPRYVKVLSRFQSKISEVRIEGHTSSEGKANHSALEAYFYNMELSQARTRNVLSFCLNTRIPNPSREKMKSLITANGLSSSQLIKIGVAEDKLKSRRVEFRVRTKIEDVMDKLLQKAVK